MITNLPLTHLKHPFLPFILSQNNCPISDLRFIMHKNHFGLNNYINLQEIREQKPKTMNAFALLFTFLHLP